MKTRILLLSVSLFIAAFSYSQSLILSHEGVQLAPGDEVFVEGAWVDYEIVLEMAVTNTSSDSMEVLVKRYETSLMEGTSDAICWGGLCYTPDVSVSPYSTKIASGETNENDFSGHYYPDSTIGKSVVSYVFFDKHSPNDSVMVVANYDGIVNGVANNTEVAAKVYPNPAANQMNIEFETQQKNLEVEILSLNGSLIKRIEVPDGQTKLNTSDITNGFYLFRVMQNNKLVKSGRVIIQH